MVAQSPTAVSATFTEVGNDKIDGNVYAFEFTIYRSTNTVSIEGGEPYS